MASGRSHDLHALVGAVLIGGFMAMATHDPPLVIAGVFGHIFGGMFCSPDVDLPQSRASRRWTILSGIWWPFTLLGHRSWISHTPIVSGVLRLGYLSLIVLSLARIIPGLRAAMLSIDPQWAAVFIIAALLAGEIHLIADWRSQRGRHAPVEQRGGHPNRTIHMRAAWRERSAPPRADYHRGREADGNYRRATRAAGRCGPQRRGPA